MVNGKEIFVIKRNGRGREPLNIDKIHDMVEYACEDISGVSSSLVEVVYNFMITFLPTRYNKFL